MQHSAQTPPVFHERTSIFLSLLFLAGQSSSDKASSGTQKDEGDTKKASKVEKRGKKKGDREQQKEKEKEKEGKVIYDRVSHSMN